MWTAINSTFILASAYFNADRAQEKFGMQEQCEIGILVSDISCLPVKCVHSNMHKLRCSSWRDILLLRLLVLLPHCSLSSSKLSGHTWALCA